MRTKPKPADPYKPPPPNNPAPFPTPDPPQPTVRKGDLNPPERTDEELEEWRDGPEGRGGRR